MRRHPLRAHWVGEQSGGHSHAVRRCGRREWRASSTGAPVRLMHRTARRMERTEWRPPTALRRERSVEATPLGGAPRWAPLSGGCIVRPRPRSASAPSSWAATRARGGVCRVGSPVVASARATRHGFGRPPGYCRERRRTGGGFGDGDRAARSRLAVTSSSRCSNCSGVRCVRVGLTIGASGLGWVTSRHPCLSRPVPGPRRRSRPDRWCGYCAVRPAKRNIGWSGLPRGGTRGRPTDGWSVGRPDGVPVSSASWP